MLSLDPSLIASHTRKKVNASLKAASEDQVKSAYRVNLKAEPDPGMNGTIEPDQMKTMVKEPEKPVPDSISGVVHTSDKFLVTDRLFSSSNVFLLMNFPLMLQFKLIP